MDELTRRIGFTIGALLLFRLGSHIPIPGVDMEAWIRASAGVQNFQNSSFGVANILAEGALRRLSIFALGLTPYISAAILIQVASVVSSRVRAVPRRDEAGRRIIVRATLALTLVLATFQGLGIASGLQRIADVVPNPGPWFAFTTALTFAGGTLVLTWLSEQITRRGICSGISAILLVALAPEALRAVASALELENLGELSGGSLLGSALLAVVLVFGIVFVERARLKLPLQFAQRMIGDRSIEAESGVLSLKLNNAGLLPAAVAPWFFYLPLTAAAAIVGSDQPLLRAIIGEMQVGHAAYMIFNSVVILVLVFVYTAHVVDPDHVADRLEAWGGAVRGVAPGEPTADHVDRVVTHVTILGAVYLALVYLAPELLGAYTELPFFVGGTAVLVAVGAALDIEAGVRAFGAKGHVGG